jgi:hypothetical protein
MINIIYKLLTAWKFWTVWAILVRRSCMLNERHLISYEEAWSPEGYVRIVLNFELERCKKSCRGLFQSGHAGFCPKLEWNQRCAGRGLRTAVGGGDVGGVKFIGSSELWCWEVVKLLSYTRRGRVSGLSLVVYCCCCCLFTSLPCRGLFTTTRPLNTTNYVVPNTILRTKCRYIYIFFSVCVLPGLEKGKHIWTLQEGSFYTTRKLGLHLGLHVRTMSGFAK